MGWWHEPNKLIWKTKIPHGKNRIDNGLYGIIQHTTLSCNHFVVHFLKYEGIGPTAGPNKSEYGWVELWPVAPMQYSTERDASAAAKQYLPSLVTAAMPETFERRPYRIPPKPEKVKEILPEGARIMAFIMQWPDGKFEVRYFAHLFLGTWPDGTEEWDWMRHRHEMATYTDTLESAEEIALIEIAAFADDPVLKAPFNPNSLFPV